MSLTYTEEGLWVCGIRRLATMKKFDQIKQAFERPQLLVPQLGDEAVTQDLLKSFLTKLNPKIAKIFCGVGEIDQLKWLMTNQTFPQNHNFKECFDTAVTNKNAPLILFLFNTVKNGYNTFYTIVQQIIKFNHDMSELQFFLTSCKVKLHFVLGKEMLVKRIYDWALTYKRYDLILWLERKNLYFEVGSVRTWIELRPTDEMAPRLFDKMICVGHHPRDVIQDVYEEHGQNFAFLMAKYRTYTLRNIQALISTVLEKEQGCSTNVDKIITTLLGLSGVRDNERLTKYVIQRFLHMSDTEVQFYGRRNSARGENARIVLFRIHSIQSLQDLFRHALKYAQDNHIFVAHVTVLTTLFNEVHDSNFRTGPVEQRNSFSFEHRSWVDQSEDRLEEDQEIVTFIPKYNGVVLDAPLVQRLVEAGYTEASSTPLDLECTVCYNESEVKALIITRCNHLFCFGCITRWLQSNNTCPMCRSRIVRSESQYVLVPEPESS